MKNIKIVYIYIGGFVMAVLLFYFIANSNNAANTHSAPSLSGINVQEMPMDSIHKRLKNSLAQSPSKNNVISSIKQHMDELKKATDEHPHDTLKMREYAEFLSAAHQNEQAIEYYNKILKVNPRRTDILSSLVFIYFSSDDLTKAGQTLEKILLIDKNNVEAIYNLGAVSANKGDRVKARQLWSRIISDYPASPLVQKAKDSIARL